MEQVHVGLIVLAVALFFGFNSITGLFKSKLAARVVDEIDAEYDYVIIGAGSAGSVVTSRLSEDAGSKVLLLEAGGNYDENPLFHVPIEWLSLQHTSHDWDYYTVPQTHSNKGLNDNVGYLPRGRVLGGTSVLNAMQYTRGSPFEFDDWAKAGCTGWSYKDVLPYFKKSEDILIDELKSSKYHSSGGPLGISPSGVTPMQKYYLKAGEEMGHNIVDYNSFDQEGISKLQLTVRHGIRSSTGVEFLGRAAGRKNLHIAIKSHVTKIKIEGKKVTGVYFVRDGRKQFVKVNKEVIVSGGTVNSPQILMLSGIGPKAHLEKLGIPVVADLPVGQNLQDHQMVMMFSEVNQPICITPKEVDSLYSRFQYAVFGTGVKSISSLDANGFYYVDESLRGKASVEMQFIYLSRLVPKNNFNFKDSVAKEYLKDNVNKHGFTVFLSLAHPRSRGSITLQSADPFDYPLLDPQYLKDKADIRDIIGGIRIWEKMASTPTMKKLGVSIDRMKFSFCSQHEFRSDAYWECIIRHLAVTVYHYSSTCKMGAKSDPSAVVDPELRVKGISGLRVADASVLPGVSAGNTNAPTIMVAEKAADMIRGIDSVKKYRIDT